MHCTIVSQVGKFDSNKCVSIQKVPATVFFVEILLLQVSSSPVSSWFFAFAEHVDV
jgi:hypothetical protein